MKTRHHLSWLNIPGLGRGRNRPPAGSGNPPTPAVKPPILLVSEDTDLLESLRRAVEQRGHAVVQARELVPALEAVRSAAPVAVLLDLDLPSQAAWRIADGLLQDESCPPLILLTGRREQFDVSTAMRAGSLVDKSGGVATVLEAVDHAMSLPDANRVERNAIQRILIQWLRPCAWPVPVTPTYRFWGLNE